MSISQYAYHRVPSWPTTAAIGQRPTKACGAPHVWWVAYREKHHTTCTLFFLSPHAIQNGFSQDPGHETMSRFMYVSLPIMTIFILTLYPGYSQVFPSLSNVFLGLPRSLHVFLGPSQVKKHKAKRRAHYRTKIPIHAIVLPTYQAYLPTFYTFLLRTYLF